MSHWKLALLAASLAIQTAPQAVAIQTEHASITGPTHSVSRPTPSIVSAEGRVVEANLKKKSPTLKIVEKEGSPSWTAALDWKWTAVWQKGQILKLTDLKKGQRVKLRYTEKRGRRSARSIEIF